MDSIATPHLQAWDHLVNNPTQWIDESARKTMNSPDFRFNDPTEANPPSTQVLWLNSRFVPPHVRSALPQLRLQMQAPA